LEKEKMKTKRTLLLLVTFIVSAAASFGGSVAIVEGDFWTDNLADNLSENGQTVTLISNYTAASLSAYDAVIHYGNSFDDHAALEEYVNEGGVLVETPWYQYNQNPPANLQMWSASSANHYTPYPGVTTLQPGHPLLAGVAFPVSGSFDVGREEGTAWASGVDQIANWADGEVMIGMKTLGAGSIIGINMQVITSDTAYEVIDQAWATQLFVNAVTVPEPCTVALLSLGGLLLRRRK